MRTTAHRRVRAVARGLFVGSIVLSATLCAACDGCGDAAGIQDGRFDPGPMPEDVPLPGAVYQEAYDRALSELNADNAHERLVEIERLVRREREELR